MKTVQFPAPYDGNLTVPALYPGKPRPQNVKVALEKGRVKALNALADALIAGGQFVLIADHGPDPILVPFSVAAGSDSSSDTPAGEPQSEPNDDSEPLTDAEPVSEPSGEKTPGENGDGQTSSETPETTEPTETIEPRELPPGETLVAEPAPEGLTEVGQVEAADLKPISDETLRAIQEKSAKKKNR